MRSPPSSDVQGGSHETAHKRGLFKGDDTLTMLVHQPLQHQGELRVVLRGLHLRHAPQHIERVAVRVVDSPAP